MADAVDVDIASEVASARRVARHLAFYARISVAAGWIVVAASLLSWLLGYAELFYAIDVLLVIGFGGVVSGLAMYATSWNMRLGATRLELTARDAT